MNSLAWVMEGLIGVGNVGIWDLGGKSLWDSRDEDPYGDCH